MICYIGNKGIGNYIKFIRKNLSQGKEISIKTRGKNISTAFFISLTICKEMNVRIKEIIPKENYFNDKLIPEVEIILIR